jgi:replicative DNA helicase
VDGSQEVSGASTKLVVLDYAQVFASPTNLEGEIATLAAGLNQRAQERGFASLLLSQVSSDVIRRGRDRYHSAGDVSGFCPGLGDTEWCRRVEKSSKAVWALVRPGGWRREMGEDVPDDHAELHVRKANFGPRGFVKLGWNGPACKFLNLEAP